MKPHGYLDLKWSGEVLYVQAFGPFNDEGAAEAAAAYLAAVQEKTRPAVFSVIEILNNESVGPPQTMAEVGKMWRLLGTLGCRALALVYANAVQRELAEAHLPPFGRAFSLLADAEKWIREARAGEPD